MELTLHTPVRLSTVPDANTPHRTEIIHEPDTDRKYPYRVMVNGEEYNRTTTEEAARGEIPDALTYADKRRAKQNREYVGGHYQVPGEIVTLRITMRETINGHPMAVLEEAQGDIQTRRGKKVGYSNQPGVAGVVPDLPIEGVGGLHWRLRGSFNGPPNNNIRSSIAWADADEQMRRYPSGTEGEVHQRRVGMQQFYNREMLGQARKWKSRVGATAGV